MQSEIRGGLGPQLTPFVLNHRLFLLAEEEDDDDDDDSDDDTEEDADDDDDDLEEGEIRG